MTDTYQQTIVDNTSYVKYGFLSLNHRGHKEHRAKGQKGFVCSLLAEMLTAES